MRTQLLCTFTAPKVLHKTVDTIIESYDILFNKVFVLKSQSTPELMCTYNIDSSIQVNILANTISLHRKKMTNTLYTINALNVLIKMLNNGVLDTSYQVDWDNYRNCMLVTNDEGLKRIDTEVQEVIHIYFSYIYI